MIVAIIETTVSGVEPVIEFRDAVDEAAGISAYCNDYSPPLDTADYTGFETTASTAKSQPDGGWYYDFDTPGLVQSLVGAKAAKNAAIDARTIELINLGFQYAGKIFSLSNNAQSYWNGLGNLAANGLLVDNPSLLADPPGSPTTGDKYTVDTSPSGAWVGHEGEIAEWDGAAWIYSAATFPLTVNTLDDASTYGIGSVAEAVGVFATAAATVKARLASGTTLKNQVRSATTTTEINAVVDTR